MVTTKEFLDLYQATPPPPPRCDVRAIKSGEHCPEEPKYVIHTFSDLAFYRLCRRCLGDSVALMVDRGASINVERL